MCLALVVVWLYNPMAEKSKSHNKLWWIYDIFLIASSCFICWFFLSHAEQLNYRIFNVDVMTTTEVIVAVLLVINVMEAVRRVVSMSLFWVICFFLAYAWFGQYIPGLFRFSGISFPKLMEVLMYGENGIFGSPLVTSLGTLFYFLVFGTFFSNCGGGGVLIDGGMKLSDKTVGGPAKAAVISSGLLGMVSGSAIANVSTTGVLTIPLMKKTGYDPEEAAAVESVASTGGQIMPPIMGAGAFIMAEIIGVQYAQIAEAAILPAVAYFLAVFILVHMIAKKKGLGKDSGVHYEGKPILPRVYRLLPIIVLVIMIIMGYSLPRSAIYCTIFSIIIAAISPETRMSPRKLLQTLMDGVRQAANIAIPTAACGIMIGIVVNSGVAVKIAKLIGTSGEGSLFIALLIAALGCLLLGMALPTVAAYLILSLCSHRRSRVWASPLWSPICSSSTSVSWLRSLLPSVWHPLLQQASRVQAHGRPAGRHSPSPSPLSSSPLHSCIVPLSCWKALWWRSSLHTSSSLQPPICWPAASLATCSVP